MDETRHTIYNSANLFKVDLRTELHTDDPAFDVGVLHYRGVRHILSFPGCGAGLLPGCCSQVLSRCWCFPSVMNRWRRWVVTLMWVR